MKESRDNSLDVAKGIGILLVVIGHHTISNYLQRLMFLF